MDKNLESLKGLIQMNLVSLFHIVVVGPLLVLAGLRCTCKSNRVLSSVLLFLGLGVMAYHTYQMYMRNPSKIMELAIVLVVGLGLVLILGKHIM